MVNNQKVTPLEKNSLLTLLFFFTANSLIVCSRFPVPLHKDRSCSFLIQWHFSKTGPIIVNRRDIEKMHLCAVFSLKFYDHNQFVSEIKHFLCIIFVVQLLGYSGSFRNRDITSPFEFFSIPIADVYAYLHNIFLRAFRYCTEKPLSINSIMSIKYFIMTSI